MIRGFCNIAKLGYGQRLLFCLEIENTDCEESTKVV